MTPKLLEIVVKGLCVHLSTCAPHEDYQFNLPPSVLTFRIACYFVEALDKAAVQSPSSRHLCGVY